MDLSERLKMPLFPIRIVKELTALTPRQIRYYEAHGFVQPARTEGNQRLYSFVDVDRLLEIKELTDRGVNMAGIKEMFADREKRQKKISDEYEEAKRIREQMKWDALTNPKMHKASMIQGQISHFFH